MFHSVWRWLWNKVENLQFKLFVLFLFISWIARWLYFSEFVSFYFIIKLCFITILNYKITYWPTSLLLLNFVKHTVCITLKKWHLSELRSWRPFSLRLRQITQTSALKIPHSMSIRPHSIIVYYSHLRSGVPATSLVAFTSCVEPPVVKKTDYCWGICKLYKY